MYDLGKPISLQKPLKELLKSRKFVLQCNRKLSPSKKIEQFVDQTCEVGSFYFYKQGDMFRNNKIVEKSN